MLRTRGGYIRAFRERGRMIREQTPTEQPSAHAHVLRPETPQHSVSPAVKAKKGETLEEAYPRFGESPHSLHPAHAEHIRALVEIPDRRWADFMDPPEVR